MLIKMLYISAAFLIVFFVSACTLSIPEKERLVLLGPDPNSKSVRPYKEIVRDMWKIPDVKERYCVFYYGIKITRPVNLSLSEGMAPMGGKAIPFLKERLENTHIGLESEGIFRILSDMSRFGCYDVANNQDLMKLVLATHQKAIKDDPEISFAYKLNYIYSFESFKDTPRNLKIICDPGSLSLPLPNDQDKENRPPTSTSGLSTEALCK